MTRLGPLSVAWRLGVLAVIGVGAVASSVWGNDVDWPFAPMAQFAFRVGADDSIRSTFLQGRTADGTVYIVPMTSPTVGVGELATAYHRLHPDRAPLLQLWLRQQVTLLHEGRSAGRRVDDLAAWTAPGSVPQPVPAAPVPGSKYVPR